MSCPDRLKQVLAVISLMFTEGHAIVRSCLKRDRPGPFQLQAAIAAVHADASTWSATDWGQIVTLYDHLLAIRPNDAGADVVVLTNRAVAIAERDGPEAGLEVLDLLGGRHAQILVRDFVPYHATRAELLARAGRPVEAVAAYDQAIALTPIDAERVHLSARRVVLFPPPDRGAP